MKKRLGCLFLLLSFLLPCMASPACVAEEPPADLVFGATISAGEFHMSAVMADGSLWVWGSNAYGALGTSELAQSEVPLKMIDHGVSSTIAGTSGVYGAIMQNGELWNWGISGNDGRLGRKATEWIVNPGRAMEHVRQADMGHSHAVSLKEDGSLWVWGGNNFGELGNGLKGLRYESEWLNYSYEPLPVKAMTGIVSVEAGSSNSFAIDEDGTLWAWGQNDFGELGIGEKGNETVTYLKGMATSLCQTVPVRVMEQVKMVSSQKKTAILKTDGSLWTCGESRIVWEDENYMNYHYDYDPVHVMDHVVFAAAGQAEFAAIQEDGSLWTWGDNYYGQLGIGSDAYKEETPQKIMEDVVSVTIGDGFMAALKKDGSLWAWGFNDYGQLGNGTTESSKVPVKVLEGVALPTSREPARNTLDAGLREDWLSARFFGNNAYIFYRNMEGSWEDSADFCRKMGGHLATVTSAEEQRFIEQMISPYDTAWIGGSGSSSGNWIWVTGESWKYDHWDSDQPKAKKDVWQYYLALGSNGKWIAEPGDGWPHGFICEWEGGAQTAAVPVSSTCAIHFDPCFSDGKNGQLKVRVKTGTSGDKYGSLPTPSQDDSYFEGWYTEKDGGKLVTPSSIIEEKKDHTLFAHWSTIFNPPSVTDLSFAFGNSPNAFSYSDPYRIPLIQYQRVFGYGQIARDLYDLEWTWGGSCHGMCASAMLLFMDNDVNVSDFRYGAEQPAQLTLNDRNKALSLTLLDLIECAHISQLSLRNQKEQEKNTGDYAGLVNAVLDFRKNGQDPIIVGIYGPVSGGHAVIALNIWRNEKVKTDLLQVYDPNFPGDTDRYIELYWDQPGYYTGWYYHLNDSEHWGTRYGSDEIVYSTYLTQYSIWSNRGSEAAYNNASMIETNTSEASVYDYAGNLLATIHSGRLETENRSIVEIRSKDTDLQGSREESRISFWAPEGYYYLVNEDPSLDTFCVSFSNGNNRMSVSTDSGAVLGCVSEETDRQTVYVDGLNREYEITFQSPEEETKISGITDKEVATCFCLQSGELLSSAPGSAAEVASAEKGQKEIALASVSDMISGTEPVTATSLFQDIRETDAIMPAVLWAWENRIMSGVTTGLFMPNKSCTVEDAITYLWRATGKPGTGDESSASPRAWAEETGITDDSVSMNDLCTLETFLTFLWRSLGEPGNNDTFGDYPDAWTWAERTELLRLVPGSQEPSSECTRACAAVLLYRFFN